jgi:ornithine decarboxylase
MIKSFAERLIRSQRIQESFYVVDLHKVQVNLQKWRELLPNIMPFYAMKCNPDANILRIMSQVSSIGFDCASKKEIDSILNLGVSPSRIIFAHPCKKPTDLLFAKENHVSMSVFDNAYELEKIKNVYPGLDMLLRIRVDNPDARVQLGKKYGADAHEWRHLIKQARDMGINVRGVSFHVGSASTNPNAFALAINHAKEILQAHPSMNILDIGGGFQKTNFESCAEIVQKHTRDLRGVRVIAEPGRFIVEDAYTFFTPIIGKRVKERSNDYWIADGLYGSMNCILYDKHTPKYQVLRSPLMEHAHAEQNIPSVVWGSTCDSADLVMEDAQLPKNLRIGDFLMFEDFGAYTLAGACNFNGINYTDPIVHYLGKEKNATKLRALSNLLDNPSTTRRTKGLQYQASGCLAY